MARISIGYRDKIGYEATVTASSELVSLPATNVQDEDITKVWRPSSGVDQHLIADLGVSQPVGWTALMNCAAQTWRVRASATDATVTSNLVYDTGSTWVATDNRKGVYNTTIDTCIDWFGSNVTARYVRVDIAGNIDVGRWAAGKWFSPAKNYSFGSGFSVIDDRRAALSLGRHPFLENPRLRRQLRLVFEAAAYSDFEDFQTVFHSRFDVPDVLVTLDRDGDAALRDTVWGYPVERPEIVRTGPNTIGLETTVAER